MKSRDLIYISVGTLLALVGITASFLGNANVGMTALFLLGLLILFLMVLQRRHQARIQTRILYLVNAEKNRSKVAVERSAPSTEADKADNAVYAKKIIGLLQAQQISMERLRSEVCDDSNSSQRNN